MKPVLLTPALRVSLMAAAALFVSDSDVFAEETASPLKSRSVPARANTSMEQYPGLLAFLDRKAREEKTAEVKLSPDAEGQYPWRTNIVTTTFWVGEGTSKRNPVANHSSSWDLKWAKNYGGFDDPDNRSEYLPAKFTPRQNPFYIALPYNDTTRGTTKAEASKVIPWFNKTFKKQGQSVLKGRWVAIRYKGKVAYAQWEDCGPFRTDHWQYVFGNERPKPNLNKGAGLDVSPAVRDYLGMNSTDVTDWRFVEFEDVPNGPWARHGDNNTFVQNARKRNNATVLAVDIH